METRYFILDGHKAVICSPDVWARRYDQSERQVADAKIGDKRISTVFLGLNHAFDENDRPQIFETMVFAGENYEDLYATRCSTWWQAEREHEQAVLVVARGALPDGLCRWAPPCL